MTTTAHPVDAQRVAEAYRALGSGDRSAIARYYAEDLRWLVPGDHPLAGWYEGLDAFLRLMARTAELTGGTFAMERQQVMTGDGCSADVCRNTGVRLGAPAGSSDPGDRLDVPVFHFLRWRDGRIAAGRDGLTGDDAALFSRFWRAAAG